MNRPGQIKNRSVVTAFLQHKGKLLLVRRSAAVGTYQGRWSAISGYLEADPLRQARTEIREETGLGETDIELVAQASPITVLDEKLKIRWTIHPFLFQIREPERIVLDWENLEMRWIEPSELDSFATVPALKEAYEKCVA